MMLGSHHQLIIVQGPQMSSVNTLAVTHQDYGQPISCLMYGVLSNIVTAQEVHSTNTLQTITHIHVASFYNVIRQILHYLMIDLFQGGKACTYGKTICVRTIQLSWFSNICT